MLKERPRSLLIMLKSRLKGREEKLLLKMLVLRFKLELRPTVLLLRLKELEERKLLKLLLLSTKLEWRENVLRFKLE